MKAEVKKLWVEALRSGEFKQGKGFLRVVSNIDGDVSFCCLGVLCEVYRRETGNGYWGEVSDNRFFTEEDRDDVFPPTPVAEWAEIVTDEQYNLANRNDAGRTFSEIAAHIEEKL